MNNERLPQRFRCKMRGKPYWMFGCCYPHGDGSWVLDNGDAGFGSDPWEIMGQYLGDVDEFQWIDNDYGWKGDVMERPDLPTCCRKHWEAASGRHASVMGAVLMNPFGMPFMACKTCGNKRCPKATDCDLDCTGSNNPGQTGSVYA